jgi:hypothetical protein
LAGFKPKHRTSNHSGWNCQRLLGAQYAHCGSTTRIRFSVGQSVFDPSLDRTQHIGAARLCCRDCWTRRPKFG